MIECVAAMAFAEIAEPAVTAGRILITQSCGRLLQRPDLLEQVQQTGARIFIPTGALLGLDSVRAAAEGSIHSVTMIARKHHNLCWVRLIWKNNIDITALSEPLQIFKGNARDGARGFPANVNVAAALSLAGISPDATELEIWADPGIDRNTHQIKVEADSARFEMRIENVPNEDKPGTGKITALSTIAALRGLTTSLRVGS